MLNDNTVLPSWRDRAAKAAIIDFVESVNRSGPSYVPPPDRIATFDKRAIIDTKRLVNAASLPADVEIGAGWDAFIGSFARPAAQERIKELIERGFHKPGDVENRLGHYLGQLGR